MIGDNVNANFIVWIVYVKVRLFYRGEMIDESKNYRNAKLGDNKEPVPSLGND